jgi:aminoglycoside phosphotransferase (APT) family kinase protein
LSSPSRGRPAAEVQIDVPLVRRLLAAQFPQWARLAVEPVESAGWDNTVYRLGPDLAVRLPRRRIGAGHVEREQQWLPVLGPQLPLAVPMPLGNGVPGAGYPWRWTVCNWLDGELAALTPVDDARQTAISLARFVAALQKIDPAGGPASEFRGTSLAGRDRVARTAATISRRTSSISVLCSPSGNVLSRGQPGLVRRSGCMAIFIRRTCSWTAVG